MEKKLPLLMLMLSFVEMTLLIPTYYYHFAPDQAWGFVMDLLVIPLFFLLAFLISLLFAGEYFRQKRVGGYIKKWVIAFGMLFGVVPLFLGIGYSGISYAKELAYERSIRQAHISELHDELLLSAQGNPMGIRVTFTIEFPATNIHSLEYSLSFHKEEGHVHAFDYMQGYGRPVMLPQPSEFDYYYKKNTPYKVTMDFIPAVYKYSEINKDGTRIWTESYYDDPLGNPDVGSTTERCLSFGPSMTEEEFRLFIATNYSQLVPFEFNVRANDITILDTHIAGSYSMDAFHGGAVSDGVAQCVD